MNRKYPGLFVLAFVVAGISLADTTKLPSGFFLLVALVLVLIGFYAVHRGSRTVAAVAFAAGLGSAAAFHFSFATYDFGPRHVARLASGSRIYRIFGRVADWPELKPNLTEIKIALDSLQSDDTRSVSGSILLKVTDTSTALQRGDRVEFLGRLYPLSDTGETGRFNYRRYLALRGVFAVVYAPTLLDVRVDRRSEFAVISFVDRLRDAIRKNLNAHLSPPSAALASGFLIGETRNIPGDVYRMFRDSGTLHLLAVSGSNVMLVLLFVGYLLRPLAISRTQRGFTLLAVTAGFMLLSYAEPSVVRASIMAALVIIGTLLNRRLNLNNIISLAALVVLLLDPAQLFDVGCQLSFAAAWGLIFITPRLSSLFASFHFQRWYRWLVFPLLVSLVAQICTTPLIMYYFHSVPLLSPIANLVIVPLVAIGVIGILVVLVAGLVWPTLGALFGSFVDPLLKGIVGLLRVAGGDRLPVLHLQWQLPPRVESAAVLSAYLLLVAVTLAIAQKMYRRLAVTLTLGLICFGLAGMTFFRPGQPTDRVLTLTNVPGGVAAVVTSPGTAGDDLILTGLSPKDYPIDERILVPLLDDAGVKRLRRLFVLSSSFQALDDIVRVAQRYRADSLFVSMSLQPSLRDLLASDSSLTWSDNRIALLSGESPPRLASGYYVGHQALTLVTAAAAIDIRSRILTGEPKLLSSAKDLSLVIGEAWHPQPEDWLALRRAGYQRIICSRIEPFRPPDGERSDVSPDQVLPGYLTDLSRHGSVRLRLPE